LGEIFIGGVAGERIGRLALANDAFNSGYGYGLYFTDNRVIGFSYQKIVSRAYGTAYLLGLIGGVFLVSAVVYGKLTGVLSEQPSLVAVLAGPIAAGWAVFLFVFLLYVTPRQAANRIRREAPTSMLGLANQSPDFVLERANISQVTIQGGRINILSKSGQ
jgi:hypothetical protein